MAVLSAQLRRCLNALSLCPGSLLSQLDCFHDLFEGQRLGVAVPDELVDDLVWVLIALDGLSEDLNDDFLVSQFLLLHFVADREAFGLRLLAEVLIQVHVAASYSDEQVRILDENLPLLRSD